MKRLMIGQFGYYNHEKHIRDFRNSFYGVEACLLKDEADIHELITTSNKEKFNIGIHFPLRAGGWRLRDPQFLSKDDAIRKSSFEYIKDELEFLKDIRLKYVLFHYPKPVILDSSVDWTNIRFTDETEYYYELDFSFEDLVERSEKLFLWLDQMGNKYEFIPVLELDIICKYIYDTDILETMLNKHKKIRLCLDIGRLHFQDKIDQNFDAYKFTKRFAKYAEVIHLWNVKVTNNIDGGHFPVLPTLKPEEGWADIETYLKIIREENTKCKILFEHRSDLITDEELENCYQWVNKLLKNDSPNSDSQ